MNDPLLAPMPKSKMPPVSPSGSVSVQGLGVPFECGLVWGKSRGLPGPYPVELHLLDAAAAATGIVETVLSGSQRAVIAAGCGVDVDDVAGVAGVLAGWHDLGKATPSFQALDGGLFRRLTERDAEGAVAAPVGHALAGYVHLLDRFAGSVSSPMSAGHRFPQIVGGHHGLYPPFEQSVVLDGLAGSWSLRVNGTGPGAARWAATRGEVQRRVESVITGGERFVMPDGDVSAVASVLLTGVVVVADWLMSQVAVIAPVLPPDGAVIDEAWLAEHYGAAQARAGSAISSAGLSAAAFGRRPFGAQFPGFEPRGVQRTSVEDLPGLVHGPGLFVVMAPTGDGKTEAALHAASVFAEKSGSSGVLVALPTMATTDAMYSRVKQFAGEGSSGPVRMSLMHSMASLNDEYTGTVVGEQDPVSLLTDPAMADGGDAEAGGMVEVTRWLTQSGRGMLAPSTVCTIDQVLMAVLRGGTPRCG